MTYQSQVLFDPHTVVEIFVFDKPHERPAIEETARALFSPDVGAASGDDPTTDPEKAKPAVGHGGGRAPA